MRGRWLGSDIILWMAGFRITESVNPQLVIAWNSSCTVMAAVRSMAFNYLLDVVKLLVFLVPSFFFCWWHMCGNLVLIAVPGRLGWTQIYDSYRFLNGPNAVAVFVLQPLMMYNWSLIGMLLIFMWELNIVSKIRKRNVSKLAPPQVSFFIGRCKGPVGWPK
jgi:hypothetical protein